MIHILINSYYILMSTEIDRADSASRRPAKRGRRMLQIAGRLRMAREKDDEAVKLNTTFPGGLGTRFAERSNP